MVSTFESSSPKIVFAENQTGNRSTWTPQWSSCALTRSFRRLFDSVLDVLVTRSTNDVAVILITASNMNGDARRACVRGASSRRVSSMPWTCIPSSLGGSGVHPMSMDAFTQSVSDHSVLDQLQRLNPIQIICLAEHRPA